MRGCLWCISPISCSNGCVRGSSSDIWLKHLRSATEAFVHRLLTGNAGSEFSFIVKLNLSVRLAEPLHQTGSCPLSSVIYNDNLSLPLTASSFKTTLKAPLLLFLNCLCQQLCLPKSTSHQVRYTIQFYYYNPNICFLLFISEQSNWSRKNYLFQQAHLLPGQRNTGTHGSSTELPFLKHSAQTFHKSYACV